MKSRNKELELTDKIFIKSNTIIEKALTGGKHLTREELMSKIQKANIRTDEYRSGHLMLQAELDGIVCSGSINGLRQTYALLEERIPKPKPLTKEEALAKLAQKYFSSHCPATLPDFAWWSGLSITDSRHALEMIKPKLISETISSQAFWLSDSFSIPKIKDESAYLLPSYDEFTISYKDRSASLPVQHHKKYISFNGIFKPIIVIKGTLAGVWKRTIQKDKVIIETDFFGLKGLGSKRNIKKLIEKPAAELGSFLDKKPELISP
jgi:hypothetical protein